MSPIVSSTVSRWRQCAAVLGMLLLAACASPRGHDVTQSPLLALAPSALGCEVAVQQRLTVELPGKPEQQLEALLEVDAQAVRLAFFLMGQGMGTMVWDGREWDKQLSRHWPAQLAPEQVLSDLQLAFWPLLAVQQSLQAPWSVEALATGRRLLRDGQERVRVQFIGSSAVEITYPQGPFTLRVESPGGSHLCAAAQGAS
jgi:hypothetical protein